MATIHDLVKGRETYTCLETQTVGEISRYMTERKIGAVAVVRGHELVGIFTERDVMARVVAQGRDAWHTKVGDVMTHNPWVVPPAETIENCMILMNKHGFRHLPVCDGDALAGMISLRDLLAYEVDEKDEEVRQMRAYIHNAG